MIGGLITILGALGLVESILRGRFQGGEDSDLDSKERGLHGLWGSMLFHNLYFPKLRVSESALPRGRIWGICVFTRVLYRGCCEMGVITGWWRIIPF